MPERCFRTEPLMLPGSTPQPPRGLQPETVIAACAVTTYCHGPGKGLVQQQRQPVPAAQEKAGISTAVAARLCQHAHASL